MKKAFTVAELLITIAIIGVVATLTIPQLISKHNKKVTVQQLKKASAVLMHAYNMSKVDYGDVARQGFQPYNPDEALKMFNKYYVPYIKFEKVEKGELGVFGYMPDNIALYFVKNFWPESWVNTYVFVCTTHKACKNLEETENISRMINGRDIFGFYIDGMVPHWTLNNETREQRIWHCKNRTSPEACTTLIWEAGWEIPDDYPVKF